MYGLWKVMMANTYYMQNTNTITRVIKEYNSYYLVPITPILTNLLQFCSLILCMH